jgi:CheY-like chemotaxis protein
MNCAAAVLRVVAFTAPLGMTENHRSSTLIDSHSRPEAMPAYNGESARQFCAEWEPDLLMTDMVMPGMNGIELVIAVARQGSKCKFLLISGQAGTAKIFEEAREQGFALALLSKPVHPLELLQKVADILASSTPDTPPNDGRAANGNDNASGHGPDSFDSSKKLAS